MGYNLNAEVQIGITNSKKGRDITTYNPDEQEILYERNSSFKVIELTKVKDKYYIVLEDD